MSNKAPNWLTDTLKDFRREIIALIVVTSSVVTYASVKYFGIQVLDLIKSHKIIIGGVLLFAFATFLGMRYERRKHINKTIKGNTIIQHELIQFGHLKWDITLYANNHFDIYLFRIGILFSISLIKAL